MNLFTKISDSLPPMQIFMFPINPSLFRPTEAAGITRRLILYNNVSLEEKLSALIPQKLFGGLEVFTVLVNKNRLSKKIRDLGSGKIVETKKYFPNSLAQLYS